MKVERSEASSKERFQKKKFSRGASSSSGKRVRDSQAESMYSSVGRVKRQGPTVVPSYDRGTSTEQEEKPECLHYVIMVFVER